MNLGVTLALLEKQQFLRPTLEAEPALTFKHSLVQQAAYESVLLEERRRLHLAVGQALEQLFTDRRAELADVLAAHFLHGGDEPRAMRFAELAGDEALRRFATHEAAAHYAVALELAKKDGADEERLLSLIARRGRSLELSGSHQDALALYREAEAEGRRRESWPLSLAGRLRAAILHAVPTAVYDVDRAREIATAALVEAQELEDPASQARAHWILMTVNVAADPALAVNHGEQALALARRFRLEEQLAFILNDVQQAYAANGQMDRAMAALEESRPLWVGLDNLPMLADNLSSTAMQRMRSSDLKEALALAAQAMEISHRIGNLWGQAYARMVVGTVHLLRGDLGAAIRAIAECVEVGDQAGFVVAQVAMRCFLALAYGEAGDLQRARDVANDASRIAEGRSLMTHGDLPAIRSWLEARAGNVEQAHRLIAPVLADDPTLYLIEEPALIPIADLEVRLASGTFHQALDRLDLYQEIFRRFSITGLLPLLDQIRGRALEGLGRTGEAAAAYRRAISGALASGSQDGFWQAEAGLARLSDADGDRSAADAHGAKAAHHIRRLSLDLRELGLERTFLERPDVRQILLKAPPDQV